jgi:transposase InsO family protein
MVYFQDFIPNYATITLPLSDLLRKNASFRWGESEEIAVTQLIQAVTTAPVLRYFDDTLPTRVYTDASQYGIAGWISQQHQDGWHPVIFVSRKLRPAELNYANPERELLALVYTLVKQGHYLRGGIPFEINVDCNSLEQIQKMDLNNRRLARWILLLQDFNMTVKHISGSLNKVADYLSRSVDIAPLCHQCKKRIKISVIISQPTIQMDEYKAAISKDVLLNEVIEWNKKKEKHRYGFYYSKFIERQNGLWMFNDRIYVPDHKQLRWTILSRYHDLCVSGHQGVRRTRTRISRIYFWPGMEQDIRKFVKTCLTCQRNSQRSQLLDGLSHPLPIPQDRFRDVSIDFASINMSSNGFDTLMVIVDRLTKLVRLVPSLKSDTAEKVAERFLHHWYSIGYGLPESIVSDRDSKFSSKFWTALGTQLGINIKLSTSRHQQTDGQSENAIRTYKRTAKKFASILNTDWDQNLPLIEFSLNNSVSASTGFTPFFLAFGFEPRVFPDEYLFHSTGASHSLLSSLNDALAKARISLDWAQQEQNRQYNRRRQAAPSYTVGDSVLLSSNGINWPDFSESPSSSIPEYLGPFTVTAVDSALDNITLALPTFITSKRVHPTFHVSKLKPFHSRTTVLPQLPDLFPRPAPIGYNDNGEELFEIDRILQKRIRHGHPEYQVHYTGYPSTHLQWEPLTPQNRHTWESDWSLLQSFDPSLGPFSPTSSPLRRSTHSSPSHTPQSLLSTIIT